MSLVADAADIGSVREIISRHLGEWERNGWMHTARGQVGIPDRASLASLQASEITPAPHQFGAL